MPYFYQEQINELTEKCGSFEENKHLWFIRPGQDARGNGNEESYGVAEIRYLNGHGVCEECPKVDAVRPLTEQAYFCLLTLGGPGWSHLWNGMVACGDVEANEYAVLGFEKRMADAQRSLEKAGGNCVDADGLPLKAGQVYQLERGRAALVSGTHEYASADYTASGRLGPEAHRVS